jgi:predicted helicase
MFLKSTGYKFEKEQRLNIYLTNSLEPYTIGNSANLFFTSVGAESAGANDVKKNRFFTVVIGNPPYSGSSTNKGLWIQNLIGEYKKNLNERKINLDDDYIKFIRLGQYLIEKNGLGILAFITNNSFIDGITHRKMRKDLVSHFNNIYILDLHGNSSKKEKDPNGGSDENVFDIQQGVSVNILIENRGIKKEIKHFDLYGKRIYKYEFLNSFNLNSIEWSMVESDQEHCFFTSKDLFTDNSYLDYLDLTDLMPLSNSGIQTKCDSISINENIEILKNTVSSFKDESIETLKSIFNREESSGWNFQNAKNDIVTNRNIVYSKYNYRPFDFRYIVYTGTSSGFLGRSRSIVMKHFVEKNNLGICLMRQFFQDAPYSHTYITNSLIDERTMYSNRGGTYLFPLYIFDNEQKKLGQTGNRTPNFNMKIISQVADKLGLNFTNEKENTKDTFAPIDILDYIYAVLHSPKYRDKYKEFLKIDFPRVPYPSDNNIFWSLVQLGSELRQLHILEISELENFITSFPVSGSNEVVKKLELKDNKVYINHEQYFDGVSEIIWNFYIGGYQPAQKWLKDRKGRVLTADDIQHYQKIIVALTETDRIMKEIDQIDFMDSSGENEYPSQVEVLKIAADPYLGE